MSSSRHSVLRQRRVAWATWLRCAIVAMAGILLAACAAPPILPVRAPGHEYAQALALPRRVLVTEIANGNTGQDAILVAQQEDAGILRWSLFDALGLPLARQVLQDGRWRNDGLLPPNARARALFAGLLFAWTPRDGLAQAYPDKSWQVSTDDEGRRMRLLRHHGKAYWTITWQRPGAADTFTIEAANGMRWLIRPLEETP